MITPPIPMPIRGEIWTANLDPVRGHEQKGIRPVLIVSIDALNHAGVRKTVVVPITSQGHHYPFRVALSPPEAGLSAVTAWRCQR